VIAGVVGEFFADFSNVWGVRDIPHRKDRLGKISTLVLIVGLAAELVCLVSANILSGRIIATLGQQTAQAVTTAKGFESSIADSNARVRVAEAQVASANARSIGAQARVASAEAEIAEAQKAASNADARAAEARSMAEQERLERVRLEEQVTPRRLSTPQQAAVTNSLRRFSGRSVVLQSYALDLDAALLGSQIQASLESAGITVVPDLSLVVSTAGLATGIQVSGPPAQQDFVVALAVALLQSGGLAVVRPGAPTADTQVIVFIGIKPIN
jgi:hypothetical protein